MICKWWEQSGRSKYYLEESSNLASSSGAKAALVAASIGQAHAILALAEVVAEVGQTIHTDLENLNKRLERMEGRK